MGMSGGSIVSHPGRDVKQAVPQVCQRLLIVPRNPNSRHNNSREVISSVSHFRQNARWLWPMLVIMPSPHRSSLSHRESRQNTTQAFPVSHPARLWEFRPSLHPPLLLLLTHFILLPPLHVYPCTGCIMRAVIYMMTLLLGVCGGYYCTFL